MARTPARSVTEFEVKFENSYTQFQLGFEQGSNPRAWNRLLALSLLNAGRTMVKPMKQEAPVRTGRLRNSINAKRGMYQRPSVTVGPRPGQRRPEGRVVSLVRDVGNEAIPRNEERCQGGQGRCSSTIRRQDCDANRCIQEGA